MARGVRCGRGGGRDELLGGHGAVPESRRQRLAMRRFQPEDYVGDAAARARGLSGGVTTAMVFEVQDPGQRAVAFAFSFE